MSVILTSQMHTRLAFHGVWPKTHRYLIEQIPSRFLVMRDDECMEFGRLAFDRCSEIEFLYEDEYRYYCILMTLFGHRFYDDPRFSEISSIIHDTKQKARMRRTMPLIPKLTEQIWGEKDAMKNFVLKAHEQLKSSLNGNNTVSYFPSCTGNINLFLKWRPHVLDQRIYVQNARVIASRLKLSGEDAIDICFWSIWALGLNFDNNPQFKWLSRSVNQAGNDPSQRRRRLTKWLVRLTGNKHPKSPDLDAEINYI